MQTIGIYATDAGAREVVLVQLPDQPRFVLIDVLLDRTVADCDPHVVDDDLRSEREAHGLAADYISRSALAERPAVDYMPWDEDPTTDDEHTDLLAA